MVEIVNMPCGSQCERWLVIYAGSRSEDIIENDGFEFVRNGAERRTRRGRVEDYGHDEDVQRAWRNFTERAKVECLRSPDGE